MWPSRLHTKMNEGIYFRWADSTRLKGPRDSIRSTICVFLMAVSFSLGIGYLIGKGSRQIKQEVSRALELSEVIHPLQGNQSFIGRPNPERNRAWENLFPEDGGFFIHPSIAPERSVFSTFHQVHCLEHIWRSWWSLHDEKCRLQAEPDHGQKRRSHLHAPDESGQHHHQASETVHFNHCVELLRNVLMCQPDLTVEVANPQTGGVTGFDSEHRCQNWDDLLRWTKEWQTKS